MKKKLFNLLVVLIIIASTVGLIVYKNSSSGNVENTNNPNSTNAESETTKTEEEPEDPTRPELLDIIKKYPGYRVGVTFYDDANKEHYVNGKDVFTAASTTKVMIAAYTYKQAEEGAIKLDNYLKPANPPEEYQPTTFQKNIEKIILDSDNDSWKYLMQYFGYDNYQKFINGLGAKSFDSVKNSITAQDYAIFLEKLRKEEVINKEHTNELISLMKDSYTGPYTLAEEFKAIPRKAGWLEDMQHLVGYIGNDQNKSFSIFIETTVSPTIEYIDSSSLISELLGYINSH